MIVRLIIRRNGAGAKIATDFKREKDDTPRISNLGLDIVRELDRITEECAKIKVTNNNQTTETK